MRQSITWVISDSHFFHDNMTEICGRPANFADLIIKNLKHIVYPQDILIHLGDVIFYQYPLLTDLLNFPCKKILTMGNHDHKSRNWYMNHGFDFVCDTFTLDDIVFSHKPLQAFPDNIKYNVHGHWHNMENYPEWWTENKYYLIKMEHEYKPLSLDKIKQHFLTLNMNQNENSIKSISI